MEATVSEPSQAVAIVYSYLAANNRHDIQGVLSFQNDAVVVESRNKEIEASSKTAIERFYLKDFERAKGAGLGEFVNIVDIREVEGGGDGRPITGLFKDVECVLENHATRSLCKVTYSLSTKDWKMVKHYIHWIKPIDTNDKEIRAE